MYKKPVK